MNKTLEIQLPDSVYRSLQRKAKEAGQSPESLAAALLTAAAPSAPDDPVESLIGAVRSDVPDWADEHDRHLGASLSTDMDADQTSSDASPDG